MTKEQYDQEMLQEMRIATGCHDLIRLDCGGYAFFDETSYSCLTCLSVYGSIGSSCSNKEKDNA